MECPAPLRPLVAGSTWRRGVFLLLGGVLALPYALLGVAFAQMFTTPGPPRLLVLVLLVPAATIAVVPIFLGGSRALEIAAVRGLLGVDVPEPMPGHRLDRETRLRAALWIGLHLTSGALVVAALFSAVPMALAFIAAQAGVDVGITGAERFGPFDGRDGGWLTLVGVLVLVALGYAVAGLGALAASMAPALLGPASAERIAALEGWPNATGWLGNCTTRSATRSPSPPSRPVPLARCSTATRSSSAGRWPPSRRPVGGRWTISTTCSGCSGRPANHRSPLPSGPCPTWTN